MNDVRPTRRRVLGGALRALAGLCGGAAVVPWLSGCSGEPEGPDPVELVVRGAATRERRLLARYAATVERHPGLAGRLATPRANHRAHLVALVGRSRPTPAGEAAGDTGSRRGAQARPPDVPESEQEALDAIVRAERAAAAEALADLTAAPPRLRRLLASVGGAEESHATLLADGGIR